MPSVSSVRFPFTVQVQHKNVNSLSFCASWLQKMLGLAPPIHQHRPERKRRGEERLTKMCKTKRKREEIRTVDKKERSNGMPRTSARREEERRRDEWTTPENGAESSR